jgi:uncharacterized membrane protein YfcA
MVTKNLAIMLFFAVVMLMASISMIRDKKLAVEEEVHDIYYPILILQAFAVGMVTGLVGAGGGFQSFLP